MRLPKLLLLLAAVRAKDPAATELQEYADLFRCGSVKLGDQLATVKAGQCGDSLCTQKASPRDACAKRCARTRHCGAVAYGDERLEIGFNAKYLLEIASQVDRENAVFLFNSSGDPTLMREGNDQSAVYVVMPMRV